MNRRNFLASGTLTAGALSLVPTTVFANNNAVSIFSFGKGFNRISDQIDRLHVSSLSSPVVEAHEKLIKKLNRDGYDYNNEEVIRLNSSCYVVPISKNPLIGFKTKELALLIEHQGTYKHYFLNEHTSIAFNALIEDFSKSSDAHRLNLDTINFISPKEVISTSSGNEASFAYKNASGNIITLKGSHKKQIVVIN